MYQVSVQTTVFIIGSILLPILTLMGAMVSLLWRISQRWSELGHKVSDLVDRMTSISSRLERVESYIMSRGKKGFRL